MSPFLVGRRRSHRIRDYIIKALLFGLPITWFVFALEMTVLSVDREPSATALDAPGGNPDRHRHLPAADFGAAAAAAGPTGRLARDREHEGVVQQPRRGSHDPALLGPLGDRPARPPRDGGGSARRRRVGVEFPKEGRSSDHLGKSGVKRGPGSRKKKVMVGGEEGLKEEVVQPLGGGDVIVDRFQVERRRRFDPPKQGKCLSVFLMGYCVIVSIVVIIIIIITIIIIVFTNDLHYQYHLKNQLSIYLVPAVGCTYPPGGCSGLSKVLCF